MASHHGATKRALGFLPPARPTGIAAIFLGAAMLTGVAVSAHQAPAPTPQQATPPAPADHPEFPAGPGRDVTLRICSKCHSPNNILAMGHDRQGWSEQITKMVDFGAQGTDEEFTSILDYLTKSFPPTPAKSKPDNTPPPPPANNP